MAASNISAFLGEKSGVHAVTFYGAEDDAVDAAAQLLGNAWLCLSPREGLPCHECAVCGAMERGNLVDLKEIRPRGASSIIRLAAITPRPPEPGDEPIQSLQEFLRTLPIKSRRKVVIIHQADRMNRQAANALLKILEEPHPYAKLILTTTSLGEMLPTIRSRCSNVPIGSLGHGTVTAAEMEVERLAGLATEGDAASALVLAEKLRDAASLFENEPGARAAQAAAVRSFAAALQRRAPNHPEWSQAAIEIHRRIVGNGSAALQIDALLAEMMSQPGLRVEGKSQP